MKLCPTCQNKYPDDANFCPREECAGAEGPQRLVPVAESPAPRFVPISRLGGGASGEVWQANDAQSGGAVALKIVAVEVLPTPVVADRTQRELRQLQRANSPRIVKVVDFGKNEDGRLFIASELADGEPLDQVVAASGPLPIERAKRITAQIGEALLEAQKVGVVHRDLSAKNILVSADDQVRVINFAIPRPAPDGLFGVPGYLSPEQAEGKLIDQRSNTYSLGALLYLMLTGQPPHTGTTPKEIVDATLKGEITPPSIRRGGGLGAEVDRIILKALERNSSRRPLTMRQFLSDVAGLIGKDDVAAATAPVAAPASGKSEPAFARTMMFSGPSADVQKLVAQAVAARQAAATPGNGAPEPAAAAASPAAAPAGSVAAALTPAPTAPLGTPPPLPAAARMVTPPPVAVAALLSGAADAKLAQTPSPISRPSHGPAVAATMVALPASTGAELPIGAGIKVDATPASGARTPPLDPSRPATDASGNFRETLWFKKGDVDQMVAEARAKVAAVADAKKAAAAAAAAEPDVPVVEDAKPLEDRYVDDGTVTVEDREKFSLGSGSNKVAARAGTGAVPGERMSDSEMIDEIGGGKRLVIIGIVAAVVVALVAVIAVSSGSKSKGQPPAPPAPPATTTTTGAAAPAPPAPAEPAAAPAAAAAKPADSEKPATTAAAAPEPEKTAAATEDKPDAASKPSVAHKKAPPHKKPVAVKKHK